MRHVHEIMQNCPGLFCLCQEILTICKQAPVAYVP